MHEGTAARTRYRIVVRGRLGERFTVLFAGCVCELRPGESVLEGEFDQAGLHGLLDRLRDLGVQLVSLNPVK